jgi:hypothetical protein
MTLLHQIFEALTILFSQADLWLVACIVLLLGGFAYIIRVNRPLTTSHPWVVRRGECPFCGNALFGTTHAYQRLDLLETILPESQYLCIDCDQQKVSALLSLLEDGR